MKNLLLLAFCVAALSSCCRRTIPVRSETTDSIHIERTVEYVEKLRDTTIYIQVPLEVKEVVRQDSSFLETSMAESRALINKDGSLSHSLRNKPRETPVGVQVKDAKEVRAEIREVVRLEYREVPVDKAFSGFLKFLIWSGAIAWTLLVSFVAYRVFLQRKV